MEDVVVVLTPQRVAVIGGGWAGCAAAAVLTGHGARAALYDAGPVLGGRARRVERAGLALDNGQHLLLGAYTAARQLMWAVHEHAIDAGLERLPLAVLPFSPLQSGALTLRAWRTRPPFALLFGLLNAGGLTLSERLAAIAWFARLKRHRFRRPPGETVTEMLAGLPRSVAERLWSPLCLAALNTPPERASAQVFARVLKRAFDGSARASDLLVPNVDLSDLMPDAAGRAIENRGGAVHLRTSVRIVEIRPDSVRLAAGDRTWRKPAVVVAVGPHQLQALFQGEAAAHPAVAALVAQVSAWNYEPITTVYLGYRDQVALPGRVARLDDQPGQWAFDRRDIVTRAPEAAKELGVREILAVVLSASGAHDAMDATALVAAIDTQLRRLKPGWPPYRWSQVIVERRATYACVPAMARPSWGRLADRVYLAGDYTDPELPATLEAAVRSGKAAAHAMLRDLPTLASRR